MEIIAAWYGVENDPSTHNNGGQVVPKLRASVQQNGLLIVPGNMNNFFGFDPAHGRPKILAIHVRFLGREEHLRAPEGREFIWPQVEVIAAWYGVEHDASTHNNGGQVVPKLRDSLVHHHRITVPGNMNAFFGFDPAHGKPKVLAIHVRHNGKDEHLRAPEGKDFHFP